ncbi:MAG: hypothetical protein IPH05_15180 [Flavobacteriales bacterium]|nr:hypothetical protein [Flavobacteriales bacterium]
MLVKEQNKLGQVPADQMTKVVKEIDSTHGQNGTPLVVGTADNILANLKAAWLWNHPG